jgi:hypothetical protein
LSLEATYGQQTITDFNKQLWVGLHQVDCYFLAVVVNMTAGKSMVHKEVFAPQWFATNHKQVWADSSEIENETVLLCLKMQIAICTRKLAEKGNGTKGRTQGSKKCSPGIWKGNSYVTCLRQLQWLGAHKCKFHLGSECTIAQC